MIRTNTYEIPDTRAAMRNLGRTPCMDSEQRAPKPGKKCSRVSRSETGSPMSFTLSAHTSERARCQTLRLHPYFLFTLRLPAYVVSVKVNGMASLIQEVGETFFTLYKGFSVTLRTMFRKTTTESFPDAPPTVQPRYRGIHVLQRDEHGYEKCVGCFLCAAACPANCIYIEAAENTAANRISAGERYAKVYNIDYSRCIFCGFCVEACPTDAITHGHSIELAPYNINALIYRKEQLLEPWPPAPSSRSTP